MTRHGMGVCVRGRARKARIGWRMGLAVAAGALALNVLAPRVRGDMSVKNNDYNRDGISDLVAIARDGCLYLHRGNGTGGLLAPVRVGCGWWPYVSSLTETGDLNRDGVGDLVGVSPDGLLQRWFGTGTGGFTHGGTWGGGWGPYRSTLTSAGDINHDGVGDLVAVTADGILHRWFGNGTGGFTYRGTWGGGWGPYAYTLTGVGDLSGDGAGDLVAMSGDTLHYWTGNGTGGFTHRGTFGAGWARYASFIRGMGDLNRDGVSDLVALGTLDHCLWRWSGNGAGGLGRGTRLGSAWPGLPACGTPPPAAPPMNVPVTLTLLDNVNTVAAEVGYPAADPRHGMLRARTPPGQGGTWEHFRLVDADGAGPLVGLFSHANDRLVTVEAGYTGASHLMLRASANRLTPDATFLPVYQGNALWAFQSLNNARVASAELGYAGADHAMLRATTFPVSSTEFFVVMPVSGLNSLDTAEGSASDGPPSLLELLQGPPAP